MTIVCQHSETCAKEIVTKLGKNIVIGVPVGLGKPIGLLNALYHLACEDPSLQLTIVTGLTLARPLLKNELEKRFVTPILERLLKDFADPLYEKARELQQMPPNIQVIEFFLTPGKFLHNAYVQQNYTSCNYTDAARNSGTFAINVLAQTVAPAPNNLQLYSLSCNTDLFHTMHAQLKKAEQAGRKIAIVAELNANLPFMPGTTAEVAAEIFSHVLDSKKYPALFALPGEALSITDYFIGIYASCLIKDGSCLQIGIGQLGNAVAQALILRHTKNKAFKDLLNQLKVDEKFGESIKEIGASDSFSEGIYASTEMFSDEYFQLYEAGILKKKVYDHLGLQTLLNAKLLNENISPEYLDLLVEHKIIQALLTSADLQFLQRFGIFHADIRFEHQQLILKSGQSMVADLQSHTAKQWIIKNCLGEKLKAGVFLHAGFFFGSKEFYVWLKNLSPEQLTQIAMVPIARTNSLLWAPELLQAQRQDARFVNSSLMISLVGNAISDGLADYQEVSGVGGQHDFSIMANQLENARSIINCHSTRKHKGRLNSNIVWDYPSATLPRYLRDIFITEYGIADCRGKTDADTIKAMLNITDSRFQATLLAKAKKAGKLATDYEIPELYRHNYPEVLATLIKQTSLQEYLVPYPFGSDLSLEEEVLAQALLYLKNSSSWQLSWLVIRSLFFYHSDKNFANYLHRMQLAHPKNISEFFYKKLLKFLLAKYLH